MEQSNTPISPTSTPSGAAPVLKAQLPSFSSLASKAWEVYKQKVSVAFAIELVPFALVAVVAGIGFLLFSGSAAQPSVLYLIPLFILAIIFIVLALWTQVALIKNLVNDTHLSFSDSFNTAKPWIWPFFVANLAAGLVIMGGVILLIIPGIVFGTWFLFVNFAVAVEGVKGTKALAYSREIVREYFFAIFGRVLLFAILVWLVLMVIEVVLGFTGLPQSAQGIINFIVSLLAAPLSVLFTFEIYKSLKAIKGAIHVDSLPTGWVKGLIAWGIIGPILALVLIISSIAYLVKEYGPEFMRGFRQGQDFEQGHPYGDDAIDANEWGDPNQKKMMPGWDPNQPMPQSDEWGPSDMGPKDMPADWQGKMMPTQPQ